MWDVELRCEQNRLADLNYATRRCLVREALKMEDKNGWKRLEKHLLARLARPGLVDPHGPGLRDVYECILNGVYRIWLREWFGG